MKDNEIVAKRWAAVYFNGDFYCVKTRSGFRIRIQDPQGVLRYLASDASDGDLGTALQSALERSKIVDADDDDFYDRTKNIERYYSWVSTTMAEYGYKTERAMFENMKLCDVILNAGSLTIEPTNHDSLEGWSGGGIRPTDNVTIDADSSPEEVGLAFERCIG